MTAQEYLDNNPDFYNRKNRAHNAWMTVAKKARTHTRRGASGDLLSAQRPHEDEAIKQYRQDNIRHITMEGTSKAISKMSRVFDSSGVALDIMNESLAEWLDEKPYIHLGKRLSSEDYFYSVVFPYSAEDPNGILVDLPVNPANPTVAPSAPVEDGGLARTESVASFPHIVASERIVCIEDILCYRGKGRHYFDVQGRQKNADWFWVADEQAWYRLLPVDQDLKTGEIVYELFLWYEHGYGYIPVNGLPGRLALDKDGNPYRESYFASYFELADEALTKFSDSQAVWINHAHPIRVISEIPCPAGCAGGKLKVDGELRDCDSCGGLGFLKSIHPYEAVMRPKGGYENDGKAPVIELITPPPHTLDQTQERPFELLEKAKQAIGIDVLIDQQESGVAKDKRLEVLQDFLRDVTKGLFETWETHLRNTLLLLDPGAVEMPKIRKPESYKIEDAESLRLKYVESPKANKYISYLEYIDRKYSSDPVRRRAAELTVKFAPAVLHSDDERVLQSKMGMGIYDKDDLTKAEVAEMIIMDIAMDLGDDFIDASDAEILGRAEDVYQQNYKTTPIVSDERGLARSPAEIADNTGDSGSGTGEQSGEG